MEEEVPTGKNSQTRRRIIVVGPMPPFRGGIAHHTTTLCKVLVKSADLLAISFTRQYPRFLFPGESDQEPDGVRLDEPYVRYLIDSLNPLTWRAALRVILSASPEIVLFPWWTVYWVPCFWYLARGCRRANIHVRILCHNVVDHETVAWKRALTKVFLKQGQSFLVQSPEEEKRLKNFLPGAKVFMHPHPIYERFPSPEGKLPRRADLELLFFGFVRPYKGLDVLIDALGLLRNKSVHLTVVGEFWGGRKELEGQIQQLGLQNRVELVPRYVTDQETAEYFARADVLVLPYRSATGSGVLGIAYYYGKPVIVSRVGGLADMVEENQTGLIVPPGSPEALAEAISSITAETATRMAPAIDRLAKTMTWESLAACVSGPA